MASRFPDSPSRYEIADNLYGELIVWCSFHAKSELGKPEPDQAEVHRWNELVAQYTAERNALDPVDRAAIEAVITEHADVVRDFYPGRRGYPDWLRF